MSTLLDLIPKKEAKTFSILAYDEDMQLFQQAIEVLNGLNKGSGTFTQELLFEHLLNQLRKDEGLMSYVNKGGKKRPTRPRDGAK